jgi:hypothetical protein
VCSFIYSSVFSVFLFATKLFNKNKQKKTQLNDRVNETLTNQQAKGHREKQGLQESGRLNVSPSVTDDFAHSLKCGAAERRS